MLPLQLLHFSRIDTHTLTHTHKARTNATIDSNTSPSIKMLFVRHKGVHTEMMWCREGGGGGEGGVYDHTKHVQPIWCRHPFPSRPHGQTADETAASLAGQNAEWKKEKKKGYKAPLHTQPPPPPPLLSSLFCLPPPHPLLHTQRGNYLKYVFTFSCSVFRLWARSSGGFIVSGTVLMTV